MVKYQKKYGKIPKTYWDIVGISGSWKVPELNRGFKVKIIEVNNGNSIDGTTENNVPMILL